MLRKNTCLILREAEWLQFLHSYQVTCNHLLTEGVLFLPVSFSSIDPLYSAFLNPRVSKYPESSEYFKMNFVEPVTARIIYKGKLGRRWKLPSLKLYSLYSLVEKKII